VSVPPRYLLDANVFIEAVRRYYAFDLVPAFWQALIDLASAQRVLSIDRVKRELENQEDDLAQWARDSFHPYFVPTSDADIIDAYAQVMAWAQSQRQYSAAAQAEFADGRNADAWLVAYASVRRCTIVTHEQPAPDSRNHIKLPDACRPFGVACTDTFGMLRALGVRLA
jgi:uncharacterized protein DUF4411